MELWPLLSLSGHRRSFSNHQYVLPAGIAVDETDRVYVVDQVHNKVDVIRKLSETEIEQIVSPQVALKPNKTAADTKSSDSTSAK